MRKQQLGEFLRNESAVAKKPLAQAGSQPRRHFFEEHGKRPFSLLLVEFSPSIGHIAPWRNML